MPRVGSVVYRPAVCSPHRSHPRSSGEGERLMKIRTFILATCAVLAIVLPAAAGAAAVGAGSIVPSQPVRQLQADNQQTAKLKALEAKIRALTAKNLSLTAKGKSVSAKNKSLTAKNKALIEQVYALWSEIRT